MNNRAENVTLEEHMENEYATIGKHKDFIDEAVAVIEFFAKNLEKNQPHAKYEISILRGAMDYLEAEESE